MTHYDCKICGVLSKPDFNNNILYLPKNWTVYTYKYPEEYEVSFVICNECAKLPGENLLAVYKRRIKLGFVENYN